MIKGLIKRLFSEWIFVTFSMVITLPISFLLPAIYYALSSKNYSLRYLVRPTILCFVFIFWIVFSIMIRKKERITELVKRTISSIVNSLSLMERIVILGLIILGVGFLAFLEIPEMDYVKKPIYIYHVEISPSNKSEGSICILDIENSYGDIQRYNETIKNLTITGDWKKNTKNCAFSIEGGDSGKITFDNQGPINDSLRFQASFDSKNGELKVISDPGTTELYKESLYNSFRMGKPFLRKIYSWGFYSGIFCTFFILVIVLPNAFYDWIKDRIKDLEKKLVLEKNVNILFLFLCLIIATLSIGSFKGRLGSIHGDDSGIVYSYFYKNLGRYENDILSTYGTQQIFTTSMNLIPALLYRYLSLSPVLVSFAMIYAQFILVGLAVRRFSKIISRNEIVAWLTVLFVFGGNVWEWNLANYGNVMVHPYAGRMVFPFILFTFSDILEGKSLRAVFWLFIAGLVHPSLALYGIGMVGIYWALNGRIKNNLLSWISLVLITLSILVPRLILVNQCSEGSLLTFDEMKQAFLTNHHMKPMNLNVKAQSFLWFLPLVFLSLREITQVSKTYLRLLMSITIGCAILIAFAWIGWKYEIISLIQLIPQRSSLLFVFASLPLVIIYFYRNFKNGSFPLKIITLYFLFRLMWIYDNQYMLTRPEYIFWLISLFSFDIFNGYAGPFILKRNKYTVHNDERNFSSDERMQKSFPSFSMCKVSFIILLVLTVNTSWEVGKRASTDEALANYDLQVWVRDNTPENALIIDISRAVSQRASVSTDPYNWYVYNRSRSCKEYVDRVNEFFQPYIEREGFEIGEDSLDKEGVIEFAEEFKADYVVRRIETPLDFEEVYRNESFILYSIPSEQY